LFAEAFNDLPIAIDVIVNGKKYGIIHAEVPCNDWNDLEGLLNGKNSDGYLNVAMWNRDRFYNQDDSEIENIERVYVGHTPLKKVVNLGNVRYIDTGACFNGELTVMEIG
jgi:serine/threonine protein phosphatase 1